MSRLMEITARDTPVPAPATAAKASISSDGAPVLAACVVARDAEQHLGHALAQLIPFVDETVVVVAGVPDRSEAIAREYGAKVVLAPDLNGHGGQERALPATRADWLFSIDAQDRLLDTELEHVRQLVLRQPPQIAEVIVDLPKSRQRDSNCRGAKLRIQRRTTFESSVTSED
jgi:hypothetical protein